MDDGSIQFSAIERSFDSLWVLNFHSTSFKAEFPRTLQINMSFSLLHSWSLLFYLFLLVPRTCNTSILHMGLLPILSTWLNHLKQHSFFSYSVGIFIFPLIYSLLILSFLATPHIYLRIRISDTCTLIISFLFLINIQTHIIKQV